MARCSWCGSEIKGYEYMSGYCSKKCFEEDCAWEDAQAVLIKEADEKAQQRIAEPAGNTCRWCGKNYLPTNSGAQNNRSYCCRKCEVEYNANDQPVVSSGEVSPSESSFPASSANARTTPFICRSSVLSGEIIKKSITFTQNTAQLQIVLKHRSFEMKFIRIPAGRFQMGSVGGLFGEYGRGQNERKHWVTLTKDFFLAECPIEIGEIGCRNTLDVSIFLDDLNMCLPIERYHFALPTEAQWEYAARAGSNDAYLWGNNRKSPTAKEYGFTYATEPLSRFEYFVVPQLKDIKNFKPNAWGLYGINTGDEICHDIYRDDPFTDNAIDPYAPPAPGIPLDYYVLRGGEGRKYLNDKDGTLGWRFAYRHTGNSWRLRMALVQESNIQGFNKKSSTAC